MSNVRKTKDGFQDMDVPVNWAMPDWMERTAKSVLKMDIGNQKPTMEREHVSVIGTTKWRMENVFQNS